jgi:tRNA pseudouridine55 synthase
MLLIYKPVGISPLDCIKKLRDIRADLSAVKLSYAGRLDPMAEGLVLILVGEENKKRDQYLGLDKTYEVEIVFGIETDSYDVLGFPIKGINKPLEQADINTVVQSFVGTIEQVYPPFSSKTVRGKPLFWWARQNRLHEIEIPQEQRIIHDVQIISCDEIPLKKLSAEIKNKLLDVKGDFRQDQIIASWEDFFENQESKKNEHIKTEKYMIARFSIHCSSGTYIRSFAHELGKKLGTGAFILSLIRTSIGEFSTTDLDFRSKVFESK